MPPSPESQLGLLLHASAKEVTRSHGIVCARVDPTHPGCMGTVDAAGVLRYVIFGKTGESQVLASCELVMRQVQPPGQEANWETVNRQWLAFDFLPKGTEKELILCRRQSNKLLFARMPNHPGQVEGVFHFGSHTGAISCFHIQMDGERMISGCEDGVLKLWNMSSGALMSSHSDAHRSKITAICSLDNIKFVSGGVDGTVLVWDTDGRTMSPIHSLSVACASTVSYLQAFNGSELIRRGKAVVMPWRRTQPGDPCSECHDEDPPILIAAGTESGGVYVWACVKDPWVYGKGTTICRICADHTARGSRVTALAFGQDGSFLAAASSGPKHLPQHMVPTLSDRSEGIVRMYTADSWSVGEVLRVPAGPPVEISVVGQHSKPLFLMTAPERGAPLLLPSYFDPGRLQDASSHLQLGKPLPNEDPLFLAHCIQRHSSPQAHQIAGQSTGEAVGISDDDTKEPAARVALALPPAHQASRNEDAAMDRPRSQLPRHFVPSTQASCPPQPHPQPTPVLPVEQQPPQLVAEEAEAPRELPPVLLHTGTAEMRPRASGAGLELVVLPAASQSSLPVQSTSGRHSKEDHQAHQADPHKSSREHTQAQAVRQPLAVRSSNYQPKAGKQVAVTCHIQKPDRDNSTNMGRAQPGPGRTATQIPRPRPAPTAEANSSAQSSTLQEPPRARPTRVHGDRDFSSGTRSSCAKQQPAVPKAPSLGPVLPTEMLPQSGLVHPQLHSTKVLARKLETLQEEQFPVADALPAAEAAAGEQTARRDDPVTGYSELIPITDEVEGVNQSVMDLPELRLVAKQLDPKWVASRDKKPTVEQLWSIEDHLPGVCHTESEVPHFQLTREDVAQYVLESLAMF